jgi:hypothetical protein
MTDAHPSEEQQCGHTKLFMDSFRGPERLEPCIFCEREQLRGALKDLIRAYVNTLEAGRDRIASLGGHCDSVEEMERGDPHLKKAREALHD